MRPIFVSGIALASTAMLVGAAPAPVRPQQQEPVTAAAPAQATRTLTVNQLRLLAALYPTPLTDVTFDDLVSAFNGDYGPWVLEDDTYYPTEEPSAPSGFTGLGYFLSDAVLLSLAYTNLPLVSDVANFAFDNITSYFFEVGGAAALHVALAEATGGPDTPFAQLLQQIFNPSAGQSITALAALAPTPLTDVTFDDLVSAFNGDYGPWVLEDDAYYPTEEPSAPSGFTGLGYFLSDATLLSLADTNLPLVSDVANFAFDNITSYYFEVGGAAALHVALAEATGGPDTPFGQLLQRIFNPDAISSSTPQGATVGARTLGITQTLQSGAPTELPKAQPKLVNVAAVEGADKGAPVGEEDPAPPASIDQPGAEPDSDTEDAKPVVVKNRPKLNVTKANPLAKLGDEVKSNLNDTAKTVGKAVQKLTGEGAAEDAKPADTKPADTEKPADKKSEAGSNDD